MRTLEGVARPGCSTSTTCNTQQIVRVTCGVANAISDRASDCGLEGKATTKTQHNSTTDRSASTSKSQHDRFDSSSRGAHELLAAQQRVREELARADGARLLRHPEASPSPNEQPPKERNFGSKASIQESAAFAARGRYCLPGRSKAVLVPPPCTMPAWKGAFVARSSGTRASIGSDYGAKRSRCAPRAGAAIDNVLPRACA